MSETRVEEDFVADLTAKVVINSIVSKVLEVWVSNNRQYCHVEAQIHNAEEGS
jgi:hypothetical protein